MSGPCVFCQIAAGHAPAEFYRNCGTETVAFAPRHPVARGHTLVVPRRHVADATVDADVTAETMRWASIVASYCPSANIITSVGADATQTMFHLHIHVVPRHPGDGLVLPWTGQRKA